MHHGLTPEQPPGRRPDACHIDAASHAPGGLRARRCSWRSSLLSAAALLAPAGCSVTAPDERPQDAAQAASTTSLDGSEEDANVTIAAGVTSADIWLLPLTSGLAGSGAALRARRVTAREGYDNQPAFSAAGDTLYYASIRDGRRSDVFAYDIADATTRQVTATAESEYSPTPRPGGRLSVVQVANNGTQRLWLHGDDGTPLHALRPDITGVGYHAWLSSDLLALFVVENPPRLLYAATTGLDGQTIAVSVGRSLHRRADGTLGYVSKADQGSGSVRVVDALGRQDRLLAPTWPEREDLAWLADGSALGAVGSMPYRLPPGAPGWRPLLDLRDVVSGEITRLTVDPRGQWLAV